MPKLILTHPNGLFSLSLAVCDLSASLVLPVKKGSRIDYVCREMFGKMKEGENENAPLGAKRASESRHCYLAFVHVSNMIVNCTHSCR